MRTRCLKFKRWTDDTEMISKWTSERRREKKRAIATMTTPVGTAGVDRTQADKQNGKY